MTLFNTPQQDQQQYQPNPNNGLFTHSKAEAILHRLQKSVERHETEITSLRCDVDTYQSQLQNDIYTLNESMSTIKAQMNNLLQRIERIEQSIQIPGSSSSSNVSLGEVIIANRRTIAKTLNLVSQKITSQDVKNTIQSEIEPITKTLDSWRKDLASNEAMQKSNETVSALIDRVDLLSNDICNKVDKTSFKSISSDATCIKNYANFIRTMESTTTNIQEELKATVHPMIQSHDEKIQKIVDQNKHLESTVTKYCCSMDKYDKLNSSIQTILKDLDCKANTISLTTIEDNQQQSNRILSSMEDDIKTLFSAHETLAKYMTKRLDSLHNQFVVVVDEKKSQALVQTSFVQKDVFEKNVQQLKANIETKACIDILKTIQKSIKEMEVELSKTKRKADLSAQFVSWYGKQQDNDSCDSDE